MTVPLSVGVEEEFHVVDPATRELANDGGPILRRLAGHDRHGRQFEAEIKQTMVETGTPVCVGLDEVRRELRALRRDVADAAEAVGRVVVSAGTLPTADWRSSRVTPKERYNRIVDLAGLVAAEQVVCGCHVHVGFDDREVALQVLNRSRVWVPALLALSSSSPFWSRADTGYASFRTAVWGRWPTADLPSAFSSCEEYDEVVAALVASGTILDAGQIYWDLRLSAQHPTLEFRIADAGTTVDDTVLQAGLSRALAETSRREEAAGLRQQPVRPELLRAAKWRAARSGLREQLIDAVARRAMPAADVVRSLLAHVRSALEDAGDWAEVSELVGRTLAEGTSAQRQRAALAEHGSIERVVDLLAAQTAGS